MATKIEGRAKPLLRLYKTDIVRRAAKDTRLSQRIVGDAVAGAFKQITSALAENKPVVFQGFGTFYTRTRPASIGRSFQTGKRVEVPAMRMVAFRAGKLLKQAVRRSKKAR